MIYFITGGTGQLGRFLIPHLLEREGTVYLLVKEAELAEVSRLRRVWGVEESRLVPVVGDLRKIRLGVSQHIQGRLKHKLDHFFHLATAFDFAADGQSQARLNVDGVRRALGLAETLHASCFHLLSSVAATGRYAGVSDEQTFAEAPILDNPYYVNYHVAERLVRASALPWRIYRPGVVVGDSVDGTAASVSGLYYFFAAVRSLAEALPPWARAVTPEGGSLNVVPVDYVGTALDHLAHLPQGDGECFLLTHPEGISAGQLLRLLVGLAGGPSLAIWSQPLPYGLLAGLLPGAPGYAVFERFMAPFGIPVSALELVTSPTQYDGSKARELLEPADIYCPDIDDYADVLWRYWQDRLNDFSAQGTLYGRLADGFFGRRNASALGRAVSGKVVVITGCHGLLARSCAEKLSGAGATLILVGTGKRRLQAEAARISRRGGRPKSYVCTADDPVSCARVAGKILKNYGHVDVILNISSQTEGSSGLGLLGLVGDLSTSMIARRDGHIVNVVTAGAVYDRVALAPAAVAKSTAEVFGWLLSAELSSAGVRFDHLSLPEIKQGEERSRSWLANVLWRAPDASAEQVLRRLTAPPSRLAPSLLVAGAMLRKIAPDLGLYGLRQAQRVADSVCLALPPPGTGAEGEKEMTSAVPEALIANQQKASVGGSLLASVE